MTADNTAGQRIGHLQLRSTLRASQRKHGSSFLSADTTLCQARARVILPNLRCAISLSVNSSWSALVLFYRKAFATHHTGRKIRIILTSENTLLKLSINVTVESAWLSSRK